MKKNQQQMVQFKNISLKEGFDLIKEPMEKWISSTNKERKELKKIKDVSLGVSIKTISDRYRVFIKSIVCIKCKNKATHWIVERHHSDETYHLNLYGIAKDGEDILFTKDHIIPKSKGGRNIISNYDTMCTRCNSDKGNKWKL